MVGAETGEKIISLLHSTESARTVVIFVADTLRTAMQSSSQTKRLTCGSSAVADVLHGLGLVNFDFLHQLVQVRC